VAIRAFARVAGEMPQADFHIYGEGPAKPALIELANELYMQGRVIFHDFLPSREIARVMAEADLAIEPKRATSAFGNEALSTKILEFMALGVPVVASRTRTHMLTMTIPSSSITTTTMKRRWRTRCACSGTIRCSEGSRQPAPLSMRVKTPGRRGKTSIEISRWIGQQQRQD